MRPLGLYIHWPFCARICPYCDFTVAKNRAVDEQAWICSLTEDLERLAEMVESRRLVSLYMGGGTPSLIPASVAEAVMAKAEALFGFAEGIELTAEANPDDRERFEMLRSLGFQRLSLGVQSFSDDELRLLGRNHDAKDARIGVERALALFPNVSLDFIYALPEQDLAAWRARLADICDLGAEHLSLYQLTIEPDTAFGKAAERGTLCPMPDERAADFYEATQEVTEAAGLPAYEVSNHARPGSEAIHNSLYWHDADWLAIGPGAHGRIVQNGRRLATEGSPQPSRYPKLPADERITAEELSPYAQALETLAGGLRPVAGLDLLRLGSDAEGVAQRADVLIAEGLLEREGRYLRASPRGRLVLDQLTAFLADGLAAPAET